jgi:hypothetical protein
MCGEDVDARCVIMQGVNPPQWSKYHREDCLSLELLIQELYAAVTEIKESIDVSDLGFQCDSCLDYGVSDLKDLTVGRILFAMSQKVCL